MPKLKSNQVPSYRLHRQSGQAVVTLDGKDHLLGQHGTDESRAAYERLIGEWVANGRRITGTSLGSVTICELVAAYWTHVEAYYRKPDGTPTSEQESIRHALAPLALLYGTARVVDFGPLSLKAVRQAMVDKGWCRSNINKQVGRVKQLFKWAVENEMAPASMHHGLAAVPGLRPGRSDARESEPVRPVTEETVIATLPYLSRQVRAMIELQLVTGMRPGEVCAMRTCDVDTTGRLWKYQPATHKTQHHGHQRIVHLGPRAQKLLQPFLRRELEAFIFSPAEAEAERRAAAHSARKTPLPCGNRPGSNKARRPKWQPGSRYSVGTYRRAIARACESAFQMPAELHESDDDRDTPEDSADALASKKARRMEKRKLRAAWRAQNVWHPHQLRHTAATRLRKEYGLEAAQVVLGHKTLSVTEIYAEKNIAEAQRIMADVG